MIEVSGRKFVQGDLHNYTLVLHDKRRNKAGNPVISTHCTVAGCKKI